jgi:ferrous iron transport protein A
MSLICLTALPRRQPARVDHVRDAEGTDPVARRLKVLGFVAGRPVEVLHVGPVGQDPLLVRIGGARFALRRIEADRVQVRTNAP